MNHIKDTIVSYLTSNFKVEDAIDLDMSLTGSGIVSSISMIELICWLEDAFTLSVPPDDFLPEHFDTVNSICRYIENKRI